jgi:hypothetical protein
MALQINKEIETINKGALSTSYARIEVYHIDKHIGVMRVSIALYVDKDDADKNKFVYHEDFLDPLNRSSQSGPIPTLINVDGNSINYPTIFDLPLSVDETVTEDEYQTQDLVRTVKYYDFDEDGNVIEKTREETYQDRVKTGTKSVTKSKIDLSVIGSNPYEWAYSKLKPKLEEVFGEGNVIDL